MKSLEKAISRYDLMHELKSQVNGLVETQALLQGCVCVQHGEC